MPVYWGPMPPGDRWMPWAAAIGLLLALVIALSAERQTPYEPGAVAVQENAR